MLKYLLVATSLLGPGTRIAVTLFMNWLNILIVYKTSILPDIVLLLLLLISCVLSLRGTFR